MPRKVVNIVTSEETVYVCEVCEKAHYTKALASYCERKHTQPECEHTFNPIEMDVHDDFSLILDRECPLCALVESKRVDLEDLTAHLGQTLLLEILTNKTSGL